MVYRLAGAFQELFNNHRRSRNIRVADPKINEINAARQGFAFAPIYLSEEVRRQLVDSSGFFNTSGSMG